MTQRQSLPDKLHQDSILPLQLRDVSYTVGNQTLLNAINLTLERQPLSIILGANGAGKTLLLKTCAGLLQPSSGQLRWHSDPQQVAHQGRTGFTLVFQKPVLLDRSAIANVAYVLRHWPRAERNSHALEALRWAGCEPLAALPARQMSGGQQQLIALARAWAMQPQVLFLDEPCANLDPELSLRIEHLIHALHHRGMKIVMTTHNLGQAQRLADEIIFVEKGQIVEQTEAAVFFKTPQCAGAKRFLELESVTANRTATP